MKECYDFFGSLICVGSRVAFVHEGELRSGLIVDVLEDYVLRVYSDGGLVLVGEEHVVRRG